MKLCFLGDAPSVHTQKWASYFVQRGHRVHIISFRPSSIDGAEVHYITSRIPSKLKYLFNIRRVRDIVHSLKPDILHAHYLTSYGFLSALSRFHPLVMTAHGSDLLISPRKSLILNQLVRYALGKADLVTTVAEHMAEELVKLGVPRDKILVFQYGVDRDVFKCRGKEPSEPIVLSTRKLEPVYNLQLLLRATPYVLKEIPSARFLILGEGYQKEELQRISEELKVEDRVEFRGEVDHNVIPDYLESSPIYVSTCLSDGTSMSLLEAMAVGTFPIVISIPGNREWIEDGRNGFLIPPDSPQILAERIVRALRDRNLREDAKKINSKLIDLRGDWKNNMRRMEEAYLELLS